MSYASAMEALYRDHGLQSNHKERTEGRKVREQFASWDTASGYGKSYVAMILPCEKRYENVCARVTERGSNAILIKRVADTDFSLVGRSNPSARPPKYRPVRMVS